MEYNTSREHLTIPEYGRNIQKMVKYACTIADEKERNNAAKAIVSIMGQLNTQTKDIEEFQQKIWNHLFIISDFKLEVESPFEKPSKETIEKKPEKLAYNGNKIRYRHYGKSVEGLIAKAITTVDEKEKKAFTESIANLMKRSYLSWNRDSVNDQIILNHLNELSEGKLKLEDDFEFAPTGDILPKNKPRNKKGGSHSKYKSGGSRHRRKY